MGIVAVGPSRQNSQRFGHHRSRQRGQKGGDRQKLHINLSDQIRADEYRQSISCHIQMLARKLPSILVDISFSVRS